MPARPLPVRYAQLRLRDLTLLEHVAELGSLTETAARMHVTQSAITQALQSLEKAFGRPLVERGRRAPRGARLTAAGASALVHLRVARREIEAALAAAGDAGTVTLRVGALPLTLVQPLPEALIRLRRRLPQAHVHLSEDTVPNLWRRLEAGEFDAIVCRLPALSEQPRLPEGVAHRVVGEESLVLVCGRGHPIAGRRKPPLAALREYAWILPPEGSYTRLVIEQMFLRAGLAAPRAAMTSMNFHTNLRLAADGDLLAVAPRSAALAVRKALHLSVFAMDLGRELPALILAWREASLVNPAMVALLACC
ncbi:MAG TPA: LysR family transcriptional regulator [Casimicrobiaceae bacterium]|jgi:molybdate transport repressor ModE-like protein|nr:LysR family transcriptional regulator [Casimicrobiaceae bacterium]